MQKQMGRPAVRTEACVKTTIEIPVSLSNALKMVQPNRTQWIIQLIREGLEREGLLGNPQNSSQPPLT
jgi:hypothetical protein